MHDKNNSQILFGQKNWDFDKISIFHENVSWKYRFLMKILLPILYQKYRMLTIKNVSNIENFKNGLRESRDTNYFCLERVTRDSRKPFF